MTETGSSLGGEQSGHIIFKDISPTGDGIISSLEFLNALVRSQYDIDSIHKLVPRYPQELKNIRVKDKNNIMESEEIKGEDIPPSPENFPDDWGLTSAVMSAVADPEGAIGLAESAGEESVSSLPPQETSPANRLAEAEVKPEGKPDAGAEIAKEIGIDPLPAFLVAPNTSPEGDKVKMITIILRSSQDKVRYQVYCPCDLCDSRNNCWEVPCPALPLVEYRAV